MKRHGYGQGMGADGAAIQAKFSKGEGGRRRDSGGHGGGGGEAGLRERIVFVGDERPNQLEGSILSLSSDMERCITSGGSDMIDLVMLSSRSSPRPCLLTPHAAVPILPVLLLDLGLPCPTQL